MKDNVPFYLKGVYGYHEEYDSSAQRSIKRNGPDKYDHMNLIISAVSKFDQPIKKIHYTIKLVDRVGDEIIPESYTFAKTAANNLYESVYVNYELAKQEAARKLKFCPHCGAKAEPLKFDHCEFCGMPYEITVTQTAPVKKEVKLEDYRRRVTEVGPIQPDSSFGQDKYWELKDIPNTYSSVSVVKAEIEFFDGSIVVVNNPPSEAYYRANSLVYREEIHERNITIRNALLLVMGIALFIWTFLRII